MCVAVLCSAWLGVAGLLEKTSLMQILPSVVGQIPFGVGTEQRDEPNKSGVVKLGDVMTRRLLADLEMPGNLVANQSVAGHQKQQKLMLWIGAVLLVGVLWFSGLLQGKFRVLKLRLERVILLRRLKKLRADNLKLSREIERVDGIRRKLIPNIDDVSAKLGSSGSVEDGLVKPLKLFVDDVHSGTGEATPNDPKLSDGRGWRDRCVAGERWRPEAAGVTAAPVRCSAWLGVAVILELVVLAPIALAAPIARECRCCRRVCR